MIDASQRMSQINSQGGDGAERYIIGVAKMIISACLSVRALIMVHRMILESEFPVVLTRNQKPLKGSY
jgi:hypothetical protein